MGSDLSQVKRVEKYAPEIAKAIQCYASAYHELERLQKKWKDDPKRTLIPKGDQKTGCIGEFYVYLYLVNKYPGAELKYAGHSQKGWDIEAKWDKKVSNTPRRNFKVQVKTVSAYSKTRVMSPIHDGWDELHIVCLGEDFRPKEFWIIDRSSVSRDLPLKGKRCPDPDKNCPGSADIPFGDNRTNELKLACSSYA